MKRLIMEFLGTFFFIFTIAMTGNPWAIASMLMAWMYIGGYISGAHYNPMVSLAVALRGRLNWHDLPGYMIAQILGGFVAYGMTLFIRGSIALPHPGTHITLLQAFITEILLAFVLALVVLATATWDKFKGNTIFGFAIGFTIPALAVLGSPISGGLFNPAIALGSYLFGAIKGMPISWLHLAMYVGGAFIGGVLAAYAFRYFELETERS
jgi:aquaporin Z